MRTHHDIELPAPLVPPTAFEITLKVGIVPETGHCQYWWKVEDPTAKFLLGMGSCPHVSLAVVSLESRECLASVLEAVFFQLEPF